LSSISHGNDALGSLLLDDDGVIHDSHRGRAAMRATFQRDVSLFATAWSMPGRENRA